MKTFASIVIPVFNGENYISDAIDSALAQTIDNFEVIVVNDGSKDKTEKICLSYGGHIRYIYKENGGVSSALNLGVCEMHGEYFTWLAHDDMFYPNKLALQIESLSHVEDKTAIVHGNFDLLDVKHDSMSQIRQEDNYNVKQLTNSVFPLLMTTLHASTPLIHKSHFERIGLFDESLPLTQDFDFLFRAMRGRHSIFLSEPLLISRLHGQSGKNTDQRFSKACAEQYKHFALALTDDEVCSLFPSPKAFYLRLVAMMKARCATTDLTKLINKAKSLPNEKENTKLVEYIHNISGGKAKKLCIFGAGYYGKLLKFELQQRGIGITCFYDNNENLHRKIIDGVTCRAPSELPKEADDFVIVIAIDVSDIIEKQLMDLGLKYITTKKKLDPLILETPPTLGWEYYL